jgi:GPH family glycoside/pentoside/hexuronide:cation symporter
MNESNDLPIESISVKTGINYSVGNFANGVLNGLVFANFTFFYIEKYAADPILIGWAWMVFLFWNTLNDPIISYFVDNTRTDLGRRIPFIRYGSIFYGLAFIFCWFPIAAPGDQIGLFINFLLALFLLDTMFTIIGVCFFCLPNEIAITAKGRAKLSIYNSFSTIGIVITTFAVPIFLLTGQVGLPPIFAPLMISIGLGSALLLFLSSYGIKENMFAQLQPHEPLLEGLKLTLKNKPFWILMIPSFVSTIMITVLSSGLLYYIEYIIAEQPIELILGGLGLGVLLGLGINMYLIDKIRVKKTGIIDAFLAGFGFTFLFIAGRDASIAAIPVFFLGFGFAGILITTAPLVGDAIDNDELITGKRREAVYGAANALVQKPAISLANWMFTIIIAWLGFRAPLLINGVATKQTQTDLALTGILFAFCIIPAIGLFISAISMFWFPLDGPEWEKKKKELMKIHEEKEREYMKKLVENGRLKPKS